MKTKDIILFLGLFMLMPTTLSAQKYIEQAFDILRNSKGLKTLNSSHSIEKDPETGFMEGMEDIFEFITIDTKAKHLIGDAQKAFQKDEQEAYKVSSGTQGSIGNYTSLAVGNDNTGVPIGLMEGSNWIYACFLDPDDSLRQHRFAYALEWVSEGAQIKGRIVKTYATTAKARQSRKQVKTITLNGQQVNLSGFASGQNGDLTYNGFVPEEKSSEVWLTVFNTFKNLFLKNPNGTTANSYATQIYKLCKNAKSLEAVEKNIVATEIEKLKKKTNDNFIQQLFDMSIERLKK